MEDDFNVDDFQPVIRSFGRTEAAPGQDLYRCDACGAEKPGRAERRGGRKCLLRSCEACKRGLLRLVTE